MEAIRALKQSRCTVFVTDDTDCTRFNVTNILLGIGTLGSPANVSLEVSTVFVKLVCRNTVYRNRLRIAHEITGEVKRMYTDIDDRSAARTRLIGEPTAGVTVTAYICSLSVVNIAEIAVVDEVLCDTRLI